MLATQVEALSKNIDNLATQKPAAMMASDTCGEGNTSTNWPIIGAVHGSNEQVEFVGSALWQ